MASAAGIALAMVSRLCEQKQRLAQRDPLSDRKNPTSVAVRESCVILGPLPCIPRPIAPCPIRLRHMRPLLIRSAPAILVDREVFLSMGIKKPGFLAGPGERQEARNRWLRSMRETFPDLWIGPGLTVHPVRLARSEPVVDRAVSAPPDLTSEVA